MKLKIGPQKEATALEPLHTRLRPTSLSKMLGQETVCRSLAKVLEKKSAHSFLLTGPAGVGKTTIGRIICNTLNGQLVEVDGATRTGIDAARELAEFAAAASFTNNGRKVVLVDECHALSQQAWKSFLKVVEEPPPHLFWVFCTTEPGKVPPTIKTRCATFDLKPVRWDVLAEYLETVAVQEKLKIGTDLFPLVARKANGSVRQALVYLAVLDGVSDKEAALELMVVAEERKEVIDFIRWACYGKNQKFTEAQSMLKQLQEQGIEAESVRIVMVNYIAAALLGANTKENDAKRLLNILQEFSTPYMSSDKYGPLLLSTLSVLFS